MEGVPAALPPAPPFPGILRRHLSILFYAAFYPKVKHTMTGLIQL